MGSEINAGPYLIRAHLGILFICMGGALIGGTWYDVIHGSFSTLLYGLKIPLGLGLFFGLSEISKDTETIRQEREKDRACWRRALSKPQYSTEYDTYEDVTYGVSYDIVEEFLVERQVDNWSNVPYRQIEHWKQHGKLIPVSENEIDARIKAQYYLAAACWAFVLFALLLRLVG